MAAAAMNSSLSVAQRRKRIATYGKAARSNNFTFHADVSSPERLNKQLGGWNGGLKKPETLSNASSKLPSRGSSREPPVSHLEVFDVPSDNEEIASKQTPAKPATVRRPAKLAGLDVSVSDDNAARSRRNVKVPATMKPSGASVFDVPSSDDEDALSNPMPTKSRPAQVSGAKISPKSQTSSNQRSPRPTIDSDSSTTANKRKRYTPQPAQGSQGVKGQANQYRDTIPAEHQRSAKQLRMEDDVPRVRNNGVEVVIPSPPKSRKLVATDATAINKPRRTKTRTLPAKSPMPRMQSSPAKLHEMLAVRESRPARYPSPLPSVPSSPGQDQTMMDVTTPSTPPRQPSSPPTGASVIKIGSVTPRQKQVWSNLLDDSPETTTPGIMKLGDLRISERRAIGAHSQLARSLSDVPQSALTRRTRLVDRLKNAAPVVDEEEETEDDDMNHIPAETPRVGPDETAGNSTSCRQGSWSRSTPATDLPETMDVDLEPASNSQSSQTVPLLNGGPKVTYAKQRSYLDEDSLEKELMFALPMDSSPAGESSRRRVKTTNSISTRGAPISDMDDLDESTNTVRPIHELRKQGENYRFESDTQALLDDIKDQSTFGKSRRRNAMLELCAKLFDDGYVGRMVDLGLDRQLFTILKSASDPIFGFTAAVAIALVVKAGVAPNVMDHIYRSEALTMLATHLDNGTDVIRIAKERKTNLSKVAQGTVADFRKLVQQSSLWEDEKPEVLSPQVVALRSMELVIRGLRGIGNTDHLLEDQAVSKLLDLAIAPCERLASKSHSSSDLLVLGLFLSIAESISCASTRDVAWSAKLIGRFVETIPVFFQAEGSVPAKLESLATRLCINLTNNNLRVCESFAGPQFVQPLVVSIDTKFKMLLGPLDEEQRDRLLNGLILCLGAMFNLSELSDKARFSVIANGDVLLVAFVQSFLHGVERASHADSIEESLTNVAYGYLTVLLGNLCQNDQIRHKVRNMLPEKRLDILLNAVQEFIQYHQKVDKEAFEGDEGQETSANYTERLQAVVDRLRFAELVV
ncbi:hypothetical protein K432DRAFT_326672 [Lepidopterella palustris CBS 459.81]|uniref:Wings apart-like protein C-terminal domain-containing protein n=1 Tax=Lepidopterella palustris CBS 459.81 TaxID=1314670 RepID=A0A8E2ECL5_9PEZI|nr:hypothetical protein K432DRAFT_326672 [Lepidopterella palustris CBS 459.81]